MAEQRRSRLPMLAGGFLLLVTAFVPRVISLDRALTIDEALWIDRSARFVTNVFDGRFSEAYETGHPGVTIMWAGGLAQRTLPADATLRERYARARLGLAIADVAALMLAAWLLATLAGPLAGLIGGLLLALDPFLLAHNRVLHLDGLLALLMAASFLSLLRAARDKSNRWLIVSGALAGLAALTKQPSVFLVPAALVVLWRDGDGIVKRFAVWGAAAAAVILVLYPSLWTNPAGPLGLILGSAARGASDTHAVGFFLGRPVKNPGPLFYPVVFLWRTSILTLPAAIAATVWAVRRRRDDARTAAVFLLFAAGFLLMMTVGFKKGDRYVLPSFVAADIAIAIAAAQLLRARGRAFAATALVAGAAIHGAPVLALHPYEEAHYNWVVGGPVTAKHVMVVGWGEGLDEAANDLGRFRGASGTTVATTRITQFEDFYPGRTVRLEQSSEMVPGGIRPDYVLFYISSVQTGRFNSVWQRYMDRKPIYELIVNGLPFVRVYETIR